MRIGQSGEYGDYLYTLPVIRSLTQNAHLYALERPWTRPNFRARSVHLKRLLEAQSYIHSFQPHQGEPLDHDLSTYRSGGHRVGENIPTKIARWARVEIDLETPWLEVSPDPRTKGRIVVNRCPRWQSFDTFPWVSIVRQYQKEILFIGMEGEWKAFCSNFGIVEYLRTADLMEAAQAIEGSELFIGNQSSCNAICEGLKHPNILEVCSFACDTTFQRPSTTYCVSGELHTEILGREFHHIPQPRRGMWEGTCQELTILGNSEEECKLMVRAEHVCRGLQIPLMNQIRCCPVSP